MGLGSSQRRKWCRVQLHDNRKLAVIRWIGPVSVGEIRMSVRRGETRVDRVKANEGAEKSFRSRGTRGRRKGKCRRAKVRREKVNLAAVTDVRPQALSTVRRDRRSSRVQAWVYRVSLQFFDQIVKTDFNRYYDFSSPLVSAYNAARMQVEMISELPKPISFGIFRRQCVLDTPWVSEPDMCLRVIRIEDLEWHLRYSNISIPAPRHQPYRGLIKIGSAKKKTLATLCMRCGRRTPGENTSCVGCPKVKAPTTSSSGASKKARVRRCGCKVGAKCPH
jgi:hypothetical protein